MTWLHRLQCSFLSITISGFCSNPQRGGGEASVLCGVYGGVCDSTAPFVFQSFPTIANTHVVLYSSICHGYQNDLAPIKTQAAVLSAPRECMWQGDEAVLMDAAHLVLPAEWRLPEQSGGCCLALLVRLCWKV